MKDYEHAYIMADPGMEIQTCADLEKNPELKFSFFLSSQKDNVKYFGIRFQVRGGLHVCTGLHTLTSSKYNPSFLRLLCKQDMDPTVTKSSRPSPV